MIKSVIKGYGYYVPENVVTNDDLSKLMTTNDEWITEEQASKNAVTEKIEMTAKKRQRF